MKLNPFLSQVLYFFDVLAFAAEGGLSGMLHEGRPHRSESGEVMRRSRESRFTGKHLVNQKYVQHTSTSQAASRPHLKV